MTEILIEPKDGWDWMHMRLGRANSVGPEFLQTMDDAIERLPKVDLEGPARPVVVTGEKSAFSAGLDLPTLLTYDRAKMNAFLFDFDHTFSSFACLDRPVIGAINGHAVAGGAVLLLACDYRVGATLTPSGKPYQVGLRESAIGLSLPRVVSRIVRTSLPTGPTRMEVVLTGGLFSPLECVTRGLVQRLVEPEALADAGDQEAARFAESTGRAAQNLKREFKSELYSGRTIAPDDTEFLDAWFAVETQRRINEVVESLKR